MGPHRFLVKGKKCQNGDEGKKKTSIAMKVVLDSTEETVLWSPPMTFLTSFNIFLLCPCERMCNTRGELFYHCPHCNTITGKTLSKEILKKVAVAGNSPFCMIAFFFVAR